MPQCWAKLLNKLINSDSFILCSTFLTTPLDNSKKLKL